jgi:fatty acid synthase subunit alpha
MNVGKSTLQNELIGDFGQEFETLPDSPEDLAIEDLGHLMKPCQGLGKVSMSLISKMMLSKMPPDLNNAATRSYLRMRWSLGPARQDGTLLDALTEEPPSRLSSEDGKSFLDTAVKRYADRCGISLSSAERAVSSTAGSVQATALALTTVPNEYLKQNLELLAKHLNVDIHGHGEAVDTARDNLLALGIKLDLWQAEHGELYAESIKPQFDSLKSRLFDSWWGWARVKALSLYHELSARNARDLDRNMLQRCVLLANQASPALVQMMVGYAKVRQGERSQAGAAWDRVIELCRRGAASAPLYIQNSPPTAPSTIIDLTGKVVYSEKARPHEQNMAQYVDNVLRDVLSAFVSADESPQIRELKMTMLDLATGMRNRLDRKEKKDSPAVVVERELPATPPTSGGQNSDVEISRANSPKPVEAADPPICLKTQVHGGWAYNVQSTIKYCAALHQTATVGMSFEGKYALITGAGPGSIGSHVLRGLLQGGARVIITTSRSSPDAFKSFQEIYVKYGGRGSQLRVVPFNQGSKRDVEALINYIFAADGLGWDLDYLIPFAAVPEGGQDIKNINSRSEFAHRLMLTNLLRMLGSVMQHKENLGYDTNPTQVLLPLSPNHGAFGKDGLYAESKLALETTFNKWESESWQNYLSICGAVIGWTRGTGLMNLNNQIAASMEKEGIRTFSPPEMAFHLLGLMSPEIRSLCSEKPVLADLGGGMSSLSDLGSRSMQARTDLIAHSELIKTLHKERELDASSLAVAETPDIDAIESRVNFPIAFPTLPDYERDLAALNMDLHGMVNLEQVVVVTGYGELSPWGNARTRWEMESKGKFTLEGCVEMAWIMGLIKNHNGMIDGKPYSGFVDSVTGVPVIDKDIFKYESRILEHAGIRLMEPELLDGYDPLKRTFLQEIAVNEDLPPFEASKAGAESFKSQHGEKAIISEQGPDECSVRLLKGATIMVTKAAPTERLVAGLLPTGWDPIKYGIPKEIVDQVDPVTLYALCAVSDALIQAGMTDPYEVYKYIHISELGNCLGSGAGGHLSLKKIYKDRFFDKAVEGDVLQETFLNTPAAWVNMLLLSATGPIRTPVGACATAIESLDTGYETIVTGKAKMVIVGATDDFQQEIGNEFASMNATSNTIDEFAKGRVPAEMSRPSTTTRAGFIESHGAGVQVLMSAQLALEMGVPIYGIVALATTASDKIGRSVPAPGKGVLSTAREAKWDEQPMLLDIKYRKAELTAALSQIEQWKQEQHFRLEREADSLTEHQQSHARSQLEREVLRREKNARANWSNFWKNEPAISPIRGSLALWGLTIDDISVVSFHGTSTQANDTNEADVINQQMAHLGRTPGNPVLAISQKYLTGHPKGPAGAWMLNGCLQAMNSGVVPGNRNADNIDERFKDFEHIVLLNRAIQTDDIKAFTLTSFGFGQKGAQVIGVNSKYLYATLDKATYHTYALKVSAREETAARRLHDSIVNHSVFIPKDYPPYDAARESEVLLNPALRATFDPASKSFSFTGAVTAAETQDSSPTSAGVGAAVTRKKSNEIRNLTSTLLRKTGNGSSVGVDMTSINTIPIDNTTFIIRNFTAAEHARAEKSLRGRAAAYAGLWSAKEAVFKTLGVLGRGAGAPLVDIEICQDDFGKPMVRVSLNPRFPQT